MLLTGASFTWRKPRPGTCGSVRQRRHSPDRVQPPDRLPFLCRLQCDQSGRHRATKSMALESRPKSGCAPSRGIRAHCPTTRRYTDETRTRNRKIPLGRATLNQKRSQPCLHFSCLLRPAGEVYTIDSAPKTAGGGGEPLKPGCGGVCVLCGRGRLAAAFDFNRKASRASRPRRHDHKPDGIYCRETHAKNQLTEKSRWSRRRLWIGRTTASSLLAKAPRRHRGTSMNPPAAPSPLKSNPKTAAPSSSR